jgi:hypothetical protein
MLAVRAASILGGANVSDITVTAAAKSGHGGRFSDALESKSGLSWCQKPCQLRPETTVSLANPNEAVDL